MIRISYPLTLTDWPARPCAICRAANAPERIVDRDGERNIVSVCETCVAFGPAQVAALLQARFDKADGK